MPPTLTATETADVHARVEFEMVLRNLQGNHAHFDALSFKGVQLTRKPEWIQQLGEALSTNTTLTSLDLSESGLTDTSIQQLSAVLAVPTRCPKLRRLDLRGNPGITAVGETISGGLSRLRKGLEVALGEGMDASTASFVHTKELIEGLTAWNPEDLKVPDTHNELYCPKEIAGDDVQLMLTKGYQGTNGTKYRCELATFELYHQTGNLVLISLASAAADKPGVIV